MSAKLNSLMQTIATKPHLRPFVYNANNKNNTMQEVTNGGIPIG